MIPSLSAALHLISPSSGPRRGLFLTMTSALVAICAVFVVLMVDARSDARRTAEISDLNLATALALDVDRNVELLDLSIQVAAGSWSDPRVQALDPDLRRSVIFDHSTTARYIDTILVVDRDGIVVADSRSGDTEASDLHEATFFQAQLAGDIGLFIGEPVRMPGKAGWHIAFSRRINGADGRFAGVAVGFFSLAYLSETYKRLPLGPQGVLTLVNVDGTLLVREPEIPSTVGRSFVKQSVFDRMRTAVSGHDEGVSQVDGRSRIYSYHRVGALPLIQVVASSTDTVYAAWRAKALALGGVLATLCLGILALLFVMKHELTQRVAAETALEALASTDHLTGLFNRRKFFALAEERCTEAGRQHLPLSVLMIDADHFKGFNDRYGHVAGDGVLSDIGGCIARELRQSNDIAARYGGEEFIVLLPGLDRPQAFVIAESVRVAVARLARPHDRTPAGVVTVSAGVASVEAGTAPDLRALVVAADAELYRAKREGRNRSSIGEAAPRRPAPLQSLSA